MGVALAAEQLERVLAQLAPGLLGGVGVDDPALLAQHLAERPVHDAGAVGQAAAGAEGRASVTGQQSWASSSRSRRDLPTPASPTSVTRCGARSSCTRSKIASSVDSSCGAADQRRLARGGRAADGLLGAHRDRLPGGHRLGLALQLERLQLARSRSRRSSQRMVRSPTVTLPGRAALCSRAATLTVSPMTV